MKFVIDSSDSIGSYEKMEKAEFDTLEEFLEFVNENGGTVTVHTYEDEPTVIETHEMDNDLVEINEAYAINTISMTDTALHDMVITTGDCDSSVVTAEVDTIDSQSITLSIDDVDSLDISELPVMDYE